MAKRSSSVWFLSALATCALVSCTPALSWAQEADKDQVLALSRKIDEFIAAKQTEAGVTPAPRADESTYFRRLNLDLVGRIPTLTDHRDFLDNPDPDKRWEWVERFLAAETYSRHFASMWRTHILGSNVQQQFAGFGPGFELWLAERLKSNTPYNRLVHEILTSTGNAQDMQFGGRGMNASPAAFYFVNENKPENLAAATTRNFLGVKLECAQCHAHPFAKWTREQFWEFAAFFSGVRPPNLRAPGLQPVRNVNNKNHEIKIPGTDKVVKAKFLGGNEPAWKDNDSPSTVLADWVTSAENPYFAKATVDQVWGYFFGISLLEPIMEPSDDSPITYPELLDEMARQFAEHNFDIKFLIKAIVHTEAYQRASTGATKATKEDYNLFVRMPVRGLTPEQLFDSVAEATHFEQSLSAVNSYVQPFGNQPMSPRAQFLNKFTNQDRKHETQTSILQALFLMNGKFLAERVQPENNLSFSTLLNSIDAATGKALPTAKRIESLYVWVLARLPRPEETERLVRYVDSGGPMGDSRRAMADVYWALLNSAEFMLNH
jgi:hypothetical protein